MIRLKSLLSERYGGAAQERGIWYHGTSAKRAKKILVRGLDPDIPKKQRSWDKDEPSAGAPTRESYGGVYVSKNFMTAYSSANRTARNDKDIGAMVIMELQPRSLVADEDDFANRLSSIAGLLHGSVYHHIYNYMWEVYGAASDTQAEWAKEQKEKWVNQKMSDIFYQAKDPDKRLMARTHDILYNVVYRAMLTRVMGYLKDSTSYSDKYEWIKAYRDATGQWKTPEDEIKVPSPPSKEEGERVYMDAIDQLTRTMKHVARDSFRSQFKYLRTARSLQHIGFSGKNRIVAIVELPPSKTSKYSNDIHVVYGEPPKEFFEEWERAVGDVRIV